MAKKNLIIGQAKERQKTKRTHTKKKFKYNTSIMCIMEVRATFICKFGHS
jgi:hypothetical protein